MTEMQVRQDVSVSVQLAASVLLGEKFLDAADEKFLRFIEEDPDRWGRLMLYAWSMISDAGGAPGAPGSNGAATSAVRPAVPARETAPPAPVTATAAASAEPAAPVPTPAPVQAAAPASPPAAAPVTPAAVKEAEPTPAPASALAPAPAPTSAPAPTPAPTLATKPAPTAPAAAPTTPPAPPEKAGIDFFDPEDEETAPAVHRPASVEEVKARLIELVAEVSGYPPEIFEDHLDLEVDLGIDSIKQVQTLARLREEYGLEMDEGFLMKDYSTIGKIAEYIAQRLESET
ncbi:acyl carrier protein [Streptomyces sp. ODS28]|uniref:acyl carrier protein n=1 Tax=Streptomyces sp. ODS28 TaxID=3136688 RepID=UPI0031F0C02A